VFSTEGKEFDYGIYKKALSNPVEPPCTGYAKLLRYVKTGESIPSLFK